MAAMLQQQQMAPLGQFNTGSTAPPAYTATPSQPMPQGAVPQQNVSFQGHPQVMSPPQMQQQFQPQPQQQQQQQGQFVQNPQTQQPMAQGPPPLQFPPSMTPQQQQQVQQIIQNMPPDKVQMYQQQAQQMVNQQGQPQQFQQPALGQNYAVTPAQGPNGPQNPPGSHGTPAGPKDEKQTGKVQRFLGDTLFGRVGRASVQTVTSALKMPASLSPWGDNNPVTLPNVRYRDAVLFTTFAFVGAPLVDGISDGITGAFGADSFVSEIVSQGAATINGSTIIKYSVFQIVEQAIDKGILEHMLPEEEKMLQTTDVKSLQVGIKHKLMGVDADLRFVGIYPNNDLQACEKGWFCPYLFASARTPQIPRANNFSICQFFGPFLGGDYLLAHKLLSESAHTLALCDANPQTDIGTNRMLIVFTGISPYRGVWSQSRRPGCGTITFHLLDGCPALVIPVNARAPICAWSPWTLSQMRASQAMQQPMGQMQMQMIGPMQPQPGMYNPEWQHEQICEFLDSVISVPHINPSIQERYVEVLGRSVSLVINGALALENCRPLLGKLDPERAGIVMFRY